MPRRKLFASCCLRRLTLPAPIHPLQRPGWGVCNYTYTQKSRRRLNAPLRLGSRLRVVRFAGSTRERTELRGEHRGGSGHGTGVRGRVRRGRSGIGFEAGNYRRSGGGFAIGVRVRAGQGRFGFGVGNRRGGGVRRSDGLGRGGGLWRGGVDHHARRSGQFHFTLAAIAASQALFAEVVVAGILGATGANSGGFLSTYAAREWHGGLFFPS